MLSIPILIAIVAILLAAILYFVFLPHVEGPSLNAQQPDRKSWLVCCPKCGRWQTAVPRISGPPSEDDAPAEAQVKNRFTCVYCNHRWDETNRKI